MEDVLFQKEVRREHLENMVAVALADGKFEEIEKEFLTSRALEYGFTVQEVNNLMNNTAHIEAYIQEKDFNGFSPKNTFHKEEQLADAVYMLLVDGEVNPREYALCLHLAEKLGMGKSDVDEIIEYVGLVYSRLDQK
jgi:tellurite resistance protein